MTVYYAELAWVGDRLVEQVTIEVAGDRITAVTPSRGGAPAGATILPGLTVPGFANTHSHAFHRALRGRTEAGAGTFWAWRERMYRLADRLTPDSYRALARGTYAEMALAGITCVGEFHYVHHPPGGGRYGNPNAMGEALLQAAAEAGIRITLLDTCYLRGGISQPLQGAQLRFGDGDAEQWARRAGELGPCMPNTRIGAAIHSVRAVPPDQMGRVASWAAERDAPLHVHVSEQVAENKACASAYGQTPTEVLAEAGVLGPHTTAIHAIHLTADDRRLLGASRTTVCRCPTTENALADGHSLLRPSYKAGSAVTLGTDSNAVIDILAEARTIEWCERALSGRRGHWNAGELLHAAAAAGHIALGWPDAGRIAPGALADLVTIDLNTPRLAGTRPEFALESLLFAGGGTDIRHVIASGRRVVWDRQHQLIHDMVGDLDDALQQVDRHE